MRYEQVGTLKKRGMPQKYVLSDEGRYLIYSEYDSSSEVVSSLAHELDVPRYAIHKWADQLGVNKSQSRWTERQDQLLEEMYYCSPLALIAQATGHSETGVKLRAKRRGINKRSEGQTVSSLAVALGCNNAKVSGWIQKGWLKATDRGTELKNDMKYISDGAILKFIRQHRNEIDLRRVNQEWFFSILFDPLR